MSAGGEALAGQRPGEDAAVSIARNYRLAWIARRRGNQIVARLRRQSRDLELMTADQLAELNAELERAIWWLSLADAADEYCWRHDPEWSPF